VAHRLLTTHQQDLLSTRTAKEKEGDHHMDFGVVLILANSLLAAFIYIVLSWLWQD
jgi:hypothetical protein